MAFEPLKTGINFVINQKVSGVATPMYPFTKTANVKDAQGRTIDDIVATLREKDETKDVPDYSSEVVSSLKFLRNDRTWAEIQTATTDQKGVVQLYAGTDKADDTLAATAGAVKKAYDLASSVSTDIDNNYVKKTMMGAASGVATLDENGMVPASQLPSYVDDVVEVTVAEDKTSATIGGETVTPESGKIYVDITTEKTYRWSGSMYVEISSSIALGETASTAFAGDKGKVAYDHALSEHAMVDATKVEASEQNGYVKVTTKDGNTSQVLVYTHPQAEGASSTNPHGTTAADVGLGKVSNMSRDEIVQSITGEEVKTSLGYTPQNAATLATASQNGVMSSAYAAKLDNCKEIYIQENTPTASDCLWFEVVPDAQA